MTEKQDECPVCGAKLTQREYDLQSHSDHWALGHLTSQYFKDLAEKTPRVTAPKTRFA